MDENIKTTWKTKKNEDKKEGMTYSKEMTYNKINRKKHKTNLLIQPSNLIALPLEPVNSSFIESTINSQNRNLTDNNILQEGFENPCKSIGEVFKPYIKFVDYLIVWIIDKPCIEYPTVFIDFVGKTICELGTELSSPPPNPDKCDTTIKIDNSDKELIKSQFKLFLSIGISCFIVYNWYYLMFYNSFNKTTLLTISSNALSTYNNVLGFILNYLIQPVSYLNWAILQFLPSWINILSNPRLIFIFIFLCIISIVRSSGALYMKALSNYLKRKTDSHSGGMITIMILSGIFSVFIALDTLRHVSFFDALKEFFGQSKENTIQNTVSEFKNFASTSSIFFIPQLLSFIMRITFSIILVWIAGLMVFGYLFLYSFFAIPLYSSNSLKETFNEINSSIHNSSSWSDMFGLGTRTHKIIRWIIEKGFTYMYEIIFIIFFFQGIINYSVNIKHVGLKPIAVSMASVGLLITAYILYYRYKLLQSSDVNIELGGSSNDKLYVNETLDNLPLPGQPILSAPPGQLESSALPDKTIPSASPDKTIPSASLDKTIPSALPDKTILSALPSQPISFAPPDKTILSALPGQPILSAPPDKTILSAP